MAQGYIYKVENTHTGQCYIGQTIRSPDDRFAEHIRESKRGTVTELYDAMREYGIEAFDMKVVHAVDLDALNECEISTIEEYDAFTSGYNNTYGGGGAWGFRHSDATRAKISKSMMGMQTSEETRLKQSVSAQKRPPITEATRSKLAAARTGFVPTAATCAKLSAWHKGKVISTEHRAKISASLTGRKLSDHHRACLRAGWVKRKAREKAERQEKKSKEETNDSQRK